MRPLCLLICILSASGPAVSQSGTVIDNRQLAWKAISGHLMLMRGDLVRLEGVVCPPVDTLDGRNAKALLSTFMRSGRGTVRCTISGPEGDKTARCFKDRQSFATGMVNSGFCTALELNK